MLAIMAGGLCMWAIHTAIVKGDDHNTCNVDADSSLVFGGEAAPVGAAEKAQEDEDGVPPRCGVHRVPWQQYFALAFWCIMILTAAAFTRLVCLLGVPHDCHGHSDLVLSVYDTHLLLAYGFVLAVLTGVLQADRFEYVFCFHGERPWGVVFVAVFFLSSPVFGLLDLVPFLTHFSLSAGNASGMFNLLLLFALVLGAVALVTWHLWYAFQNNPLNGFLAYALSRLAVCLIYVSYFVAAYGAQEVSFHFHHYLVGFLCAIFGEFNHPLSLVLLAAGAGIMVQGIAAYDADPMINIARRS